MDVGVEGDDEVWGTAWGRALNGGRVFGGSVQAEAIPVKVK